MSHLQKKFEEKYIDGKKYLRVRDHCQYTSKCRSAAHSLFNLKDSISKKILVVFYNKLSDDYRFIIEKLAKREFKENLIVSEKIVKKCKTFSVPIVKTKKEKSQKQNKKLQKTYLKNYNLLTAQVIW